MPGAHTLMPSAPKWTEKTTTFYKYFLRKVMFPQAYDTDCRQHTQTGISAFANQITRVLAEKIITELVGNPQ